MGRDTLIQIALPKKILKEFRFWVVNGRVVTGSQYMIGNRVVLNSIVDNGAVDFAQKMVDQFQIADAFVIDIAMTNDGYRIVECGCINCAGFYKADMQKLITSLESYF